MLKPFSLLTLLLLTGCGPQEAELRQGGPALDTASQSLTLTSPPTAGSITETGAMISWRLDAPCTGQVEYGTTPAYGRFNIPERSFNYSAHAQPLSGLTAGTLYHYRVRSRSVGGQLILSRDHTFTTTGVPVTPGPVISAVSTSSVTQTAAMISWSLNQPGTGQVEYGTTTSYGSLNTPELSFTYSAHSQPLAGLAAGATYHYRVRSTNQAGGTSVSGDNTFTTAVPIVAGPAISAVNASSITPTAAMISWSLNQPGTGQVEYGTTTSYGSLNTPELSFTYSAHSQPLTGLTAGKTYHYRVRSTNQAGGTSVSGDSTFTTPSSTSPPTGNLPAKVVAGYFTTWEFRNGVTMTSIVDNTSYNLIYVAFAVGIAASSGSLWLDFPPGAANAAAFKSQVAYANSKGKKVLLSVGGYFDLGNSNIGYRLDSPAKVDQFMASMRDFRNNWGFNGMDWDLEQGNRPDVAGIVDASERMRSEFGPTWIINFAPGVELNTWIGPGGVLDSLGPTGWDAVGEQVYDLGLSQADYQAKIVSRMTALSNKYGPAKVLLGNKYRPDSPNTSVSSSSLVNLSTTAQALTQLRNAGINIRGAFVWTIQSDSDQSFAWSNTIGGEILNHP